jgi:hypothetical protein
MMFESLDLISILIHTIHFNYMQYVTITVKQFGKIDCT